MFKSKLMSRRGAIKRRVVVPPIEPEAGLDPAASRLYFDSPASPFIDGYRKLAVAPSSVHADLNVSTTSAGTDIFMHAFTTGRVSATGWTLTGSVAFSCQAFESVVAANAKLRAKLYKRAINGTETLIGTIDSAAELGVNAARVTWNGTPTTTSFIENERLVVKLFVTNVGTMANGFAIVNIGQVEGAANSSWLTLPSAAQFKTDIEVAPAIPSGTIALNVGTNINAAVQAAATGAKFLIKAGVHRQQRIVAKANQEFYGETGAIMNGSKLLTGWTVNGSIWQLTGQTERATINPIPECLVEYPDCALPDHIFYDNIPLRRVASQAAVVADTFFINYTTSVIYIGNNPNGHVVEWALTGNAIGGNAAGVIVQGLIIEKYASTLQGTALGDEGINWTIRFNEVRLNYGVGVVINTGYQVLNNYIHRNMELGYGGGGDGEGQGGTDILFKGNEVAYNCTLPWFGGLDPLWEGGGGKVAVANGATFRNNYVHHNGGVGMWTDIDNLNTLYENNRIEFNGNAGLSHEISYNAIIRNNTFLGNGAAFPDWLWGDAIQIQDSQDVQVYGNTVNSNGGYNTIMIIFQGRGAGFYGNYTANGNTIRNNTVIFPADPETPSAFGAGSDNEELPVPTGNAIDYNLYYAGATTDDRWLFFNDYATFANYKTQTGQDANGILKIIP